MLLAVNILRKSSHGRLLQCTSWCLQFTLNNLILFVKLSMCVQVLLFEGVYWAAMGECSFLEADSVISLLPCTPLRHHHQICIVRHLNSVYVINVHPQMTFKAVGSWCIWMHIPESASTSVYQILHKTAFLIVKILSWQGYISNDLSWGETSFWYNTNR